MKPYARVQPIVTVDPNGRYTSICGSAFRLWSPGHYVTAAHCVAGLDPTSCRILATEDQDIGVESICFHHTADVALLTVDPATVPEQFEVFANLTDTNLGQQMHCFGFVAKSAQGPVTPRVISGIVQRHFEHCDASFRSPAIEIGVPVPKGMSGGPIFLSISTDSVAGVAVGSVESEVIVHGLEEVQQDGATYRERISRITEYGVGVRLAKLEEWLKEKLGES